MANDNGSPLKDESKRQCAVARASYERRLKTRYVVILTVLVTSVIWYLGVNLVRGYYAVWQISAVKAPGRMALDSILCDMEEGNYALANKKLWILRDQWEVFEHEPEFGGRAIGNIMVSFSKIKLPQDEDKVSSGVITK